MTIYTKYAHTQPHTHTHTHTQTLSRRRREKPKTPGKERLARRKTSMRLNEAEKEAPPFSADAQPPAARSTRFAQEPAAEKRSCGRPRPGWVGPRWKTKNDGQPENHNYKRDCARRMSWLLKKCGKKKARGKKTAPTLHFSQRPTPPAGEPDRRTTKVEF